MPTAPKPFRPAGVPTPAENRKQHDRNRGSARARGYSTAWDRLSKHWRATHPWCVVCKATTGRLVPAEVVDHVVPLRVALDRVLDASNLQSLCKSCNAAKVKDDERRYGGGVA